VKEGTIRERHRAGMYVCREGRDNPRAASYRDVGSGEILITSLLLAE
jgi:hypothetical protein